MARVGDVPVCRSRVIETFVVGEPRARIALVMTDQHGSEKARGEAIVAVA